MVHHFRFDSNETFIGGCFDGTGEANSRGESERCHSAGVPGWKIVSHPVLNAMVRAWAVSIFPPSGLVLPDGIEAGSISMKVASILLAAVVAAFLMMTVMAASPKKGKAKLRHLVAFKFKESATKQEIQRVEDAFAGLKGKIPQIQAFESGLNNSPEGLNKGFTHGYILTFSSEKDRDAYLVHPDHVEFGKLVKPLLADVFVIDFWNRD